jgi:hypothetical protein
MIRARLNPLESFYALTPERLAQMRETMPAHAPLIDELGELLPFIRCMMEESDTRKLTEDERAKCMRAALRLSAIAILLEENPHPVKQ